MLFLVYGFVYGIFAMSAIFGRWKLDDLGIGAGQRGAASSAIAAGPAIAGLLSGRSQVWAAELDEHRGRLNTS